MAGLHFDITADDRNFQQKMASVQAQVQQTAQNIENSGMSIEQMFKRMETAAASFGAAFSAQAFAKQVMNVRGEFQKLEIAFSTMLQSESKANDLMSQLVKTAATTPFDLDGVANGAKQLLAYGTSAENVNDTLIRLGDIASGLSIPLNDLVYLYGTTMTQGRMFTQDLRQFQGRGIPIAEEIAKIKGVTKSEVGDLVTKGDITADIVDQAIKNMTGEGSKFGGLMDAQSKTISGQIANIEDAIDMMFNDIGKESEGIINYGLDKTTKLVENWQSVAQVIGTAVAAFGVYKTTLMATVAIENARQRLNYTKQNEILDEEIQKTAALLPLKEQEKNADLAAAVAKKELTAAQAEEIAKKRELLAASKQDVAANKMSGGLDEQIAMYKALQPIKDSAIRSDLEEAVASGTITAAQAEEIAKKRELLASLQAEAQARVNALQAKAEDAQASLQTAEAAEQEAIARKAAAEAAEDAAHKKLEVAYQEGSDKDIDTAEAEYAAAVEETIAAAKEYSAAASEALEAQEAAETAVKAANTAQAELNTVAEQANAVATGADTAATAANTTVTTANTTATASNTIAMRLHAVGTKAAAAAQAIFAAAINSVKTAWNSLKAAWATNPIGLVLTGVTLLVGLFTDLGKSEDEAADAANRFGDSIDKATSNVETMYAVMENSTATSKAHKDAVEELEKTVKEYGLTLDGEKDKTTQLIGLKETLIGLIKQEAIERQRANDIASASDTYEKAIDKVKEEMKDDLRGMTDQQENQLLTLISEEEIQALTQAKKAVNDLVAGYSKYSATKEKQLEWNRKYQAALKEEREVTEQVSNKVKKYGESLGLSTSATGSGVVAVKEHAAALADARITYDAAIESTNEAAYAAQNAAEATDGLTDAERQAALQAKYAKMSVDDLASACAQLLRDYAENNINFTVTIDTAQVPQWMKDQLGIDGKGGGNTKEINRRAGFWTGELADVNRRGLKGKYYNGKYYTSDMIAERAAQATKAKQDYERDAANAAAKKTTKKSSGRKNTPRKNTGKDDAARAAENLKEEQENWDEEAEKQRREALYAEEEARIAFIENTAERERQTRELQHKKDLDQLEQQERDFKRQNYEHNKKVFENTAGNKGKKYSGTIEGQTLTEDQQKQIDADRKKLEADYTRDIKAYAETALQALRDYYSTYGSTEQKREAITANYDKQIAEAATEGDRMKLYKEKEKALANISYEDIASGIDWASLFGGVGNMATETMKMMLPKLEAYTKTQDYAKADSQTQRDVTNLIKDMRKYVGGNDTTWQELSDAMAEFQQAALELDYAKRSEKFAIEQRDEAKKQLEEGWIDDVRYKMVEDAANEASEKVVAAQEAVTNFGNALNNAADNVANYQSELTTSLNNAKIWQNVSGFEQVKNAQGELDKWVGSVNTELAKMQEGTAKEVLAKVMPKVENGLDKVGNSVGKALNSDIGILLGSATQIAKIILNLASNIKTMITDTLGSITELLELEWLSELVTSVTDAISGLVDAIFDLPENLSQMMQGIVVNGVGGLLNNVVGRVGNIFTLGALSSGGPADWFRNSNAKEVAEKTEDLTDANEALRKSVDDLTEELSNAAGKAAVDTYEEAYENQKKIYQNQMEILKTQMSYHGAHHSNAKKWDLSQSDYNAISQTLAMYAAKNPTQEVKRTSVNSLEDIYELTPEQMKAIQSYNIDIWTKMLEQGEYDKSEYWDDYVELAGELEELTEKINENLTQTSFDSLHDNFVSAIMDMDMTASDFSDDFSQMMAQAVVNAQVGDLLDSQLKEFYAAWGDKMKNKSLTHADVEQMRKEYMAMYATAESIRDTMKEVTGYGDENTAETQQKNAYATASEDSIEELSGRMLANNEALYSIRGLLVSGQVSELGLLVTQQVQNMQSIAGNSAMHTALLAEMRDVQTQSLSCLQTIERKSKNLDSISTTLSDIKKLIKEI